MPNTPTKIWCNELDSSETEDDYNKSKTFSQCLKINSELCDGHELQNSHDNIPTNKVIAKVSQLPQNLSNIDVSDSPKLEVGNPVTDSVDTKKTIKIKASGLFRTKTGFHQSPKYTSKRSHSSERDSDISVSSKESDLDISDNDSICEALVLRQNNIKERDAFLASFLKDPEFAEAVEHIGLFQDKSNQSSAKKYKRKKQKRYEDETFRFNGNIPLEKRKSLRLQDKQPLFKYNEFVDETIFAHKRRSHWKKSSDYDSEVDDLEKVLFQPRTKVHRKLKASERTSFLYVQDVTETMINNIAWKVSDKKYSSIGSSCHQCRQKTSDSKTFCRNKECFGVRGQFCGVCLKNRYGENAALALRDPNWSCPVCRDICNCSFCRSKAGKRPTGILTHIAQKTGHNSVKDFLDSLRGKGDYVDETKNPKTLLGFSQDLNYAEMGGNVRCFLGFPTDLSKFRKHVELLSFKFGLEHH